MSRTADPASSAAARQAQFAARQARIERLGGEIRLLASHVHAAMAEMSSKLAEFDDLTGWEGFRSCADWLGLNAAMSSHRAVQLVRVGHALQELPLIRDAVRSGALSFDGAAEVSRVATPHDEAMWLQVAQSATGPQLARICRATRSVFDREARERGDAELRRRGVWVSYGEDGMCTLRAVLAPDDMAVITCALDRVATQLAKERSDMPPLTDGEGIAQRAVSDPTTEPWSARHADALLAICKDTRARDAREFAADASTMPMVVHVDVSALTGSDPEARCEIGDAPLSATVLRKLACDATVVTIIERDGAPLDVGRSHRLVPPKLRLAVQARDVTCRFPGCATPARRCDMDHIVSWIDGGATDLANIASLCGFHHGRKHDGVFSYSGDPDGELTFEFANGMQVRTPMPAVDRDVPLTDAIITTLAASADSTTDPVDIATTGGTPPYVSGRMNLGYVVGVLCEGAHALRPRPPTSG